MKSLLPPEPGTLALGTCPECNTRMAVRELSVIDSDELIEKLFLGTFNRSICPGCGGPVRVDVPVFVNCPHLPMAPIQYVPEGLLEDPGMLESMIVLDPHVRLVFSMDELARLIRASLLIAKHRDERRVIHRRIVIPDEVYQRIRGTYKKAKLKTIWFVSTCFEEGKNYTADEVITIIWQAMARMDENGGSTEDSHIRAALCQLKLLARTPDGRIYWKPREQGGEPGR